VKAQAPGLVSTDEITHGYKSLKATSKCFHLWIYVLSEVVARQTTNTGCCAKSGGLDPSNNMEKAQSWTNSAITSELTPELKHTKQLVLESTGVLIFAGRLQGLKLRSIQSKYTLS
jgi:hypothetical protein